MDRPLWDRIQEIYFTTLPMAHSERSAFVATACDHDPVLTREVNSLLEADDSSDGFLESPVFELGLKLIAGSGANGRERHSSLDKLVGTAIDDRYLVESELGHGGIGKVYLARDLRLYSRPVVIKVLLQTSLHDRYVVKKFRQEVEALSRINHPGVVAVLGAGHLADGKLYIVMEYVSGKTLRSQILSEGMNLERTASILQQIGEALEDVHEKRIFHRDLKPENIMLQERKNGSELVKVVDFGIAKVKDSVIAPSTADDVSVGTVVYMSPEQLRGGKNLTAASDIYSMGVIAYEMVTGRRPFNPASGPQLLEMHREGVRVMPIDLRASLPTEAQAIILRALSFEPAARYQSATEFSDSLARALMNDEETVRRPEPVRRESNPSAPAIRKSDENRRFRFNKTQFAVIACFLVILIGVALLLSLKKYPNDTLPIESTSTPAPIPTRSFIYSLTVQRMRNERPYEDPFESTGQDVFENGDKFRLNVSSSDPGYLYVFNEGTPEPGGSSFTIIYPTPETNNGSATLGEDQWVQTNWNKFTGQPGTENFWLVWSKAPVTQLESAKDEAFNDPRGALTANLDAVKAFLIKTESEVKTRITRDKNTQQTTVRGAGDVLVRQVKFEHR